MYTVQCTKGLDFVLLILSAAFSVASCNSSVENNDTHIENPSETPENGLPTEIKLLTPTIETLSTGSGKEIYIRVNYSPLNIAGFDAKAYYIYNDGSATEMTVPAGHPVQFSAYAPGFDKTKIHNSDTIHFQDRAPQRTGTFKFYVEATYNGQTKKSNEVSITIASWE